MSVTPHVALGRGARAGAADPAEMPLPGVPARDSAADGESFGDVLAGERRAASDAPAPVPAPAHEHREPAGHDVATPDAAAPAPVLVAAALVHASLPTIQHNDPATRVRAGDGGDASVRAGEATAEATAGTGRGDGSPALTSAPGGAAFAPVAAALGGATEPVSARGGGHVPSAQPDEAGPSAIAAAVDADTDAHASDGNASTGPRRPTAAHAAAAGAIISTPQDEMVRAGRATLSPVTAPSPVTAAAADTALASRTTDTATPGPPATADAGAERADDGSLAPGKAAPGASSRLAAATMGTAGTSSRRTDTETAPVQAARNTTKIAQGQTAGTPPAADAVSTATGGPIDAAISREHGNPVISRERGNPAISRDGAGPTIHQGAGKEDASTSANSASMDIGTRADDIAVSHTMPAAADAYDDGAELAGKASERGLSRREMPDGITATSRENAATVSMVGRGITIGTERDRLGHTVHGVDLPLARQAGAASNDGAFNDPPSRRAINDPPSRSVTSDPPPHDVTARGLATLAGGALGGGSGESAAPHATGDGTLPAQAVAFLNGEARQGAQPRAVDETSAAPAQEAVFRFGQRAARDSGPLDGVGRLSTAPRVLGMAGEEHQPHLSGKRAAAPENAEAHASAAPLAAWLPALVGAPVASAGPARPAAHSDGDIAIGPAGSAGVGHAATAGAPATTAPATRSHGAAQTRQPDAWAALLPGGIHTTPHEHTDAGTQPAPPSVERTAMTPISEGIFVRMGALRATPSWSSFHVVLQPQALGMVTVHMERSTAGLHVSILPQHAEAQALLDKHLPELVAQLRAADPDGSLRVNVLPVNLTAPQHNATATTAVQPAAATSDSGAFSGQGAQAQLGGQSQGFEQGHPPPEWRPPETAQARPAMLAATAAAPVSRPGPKGRIATARTARIDVQA